MLYVDQLGLKHETDDKRCIYNDGFKVSWMTALFMGICCNTCRSLPNLPKDGEVPKFVEVPRVELKTGGLLYINDVLYRFVEVSHTLDGEGTSSRATFESIDTNKGYVHVHREDDFGGAMPQEAKDLPSSTEDRSRFRFEDI